MKTPRLLITLSAMAALCTGLSSCHRWNTGRCIEDAFITCTGVDVDHPVDGKVYRTGSGEETAYYMLAPEITYSPSHSLIAYQGLKRSWWDSRYPAYVRNTGKQRWVEVSPGGWEPMIDRHHREHHIPSRGCHWNYRRDVDKLPAGAVLALQGVSVPGRRETDWYTSRQEEGNIPSAPLGAKVLAAPFTYAIDPVLTIGTWVVDAVVGSADYVLYNPVDSLSRCLSGIGSKTLTAEEKQLLAGSNVIAVFKNWQGALVERYYIDTETGELEEDKARCMSDHTWLEELPYFVDKRKPCVLMFYWNGNTPSEKVRNDMVARLKSIGLPVRDVFVSCGAKRYRHYQM